MVLWQIFSPMDPLSFVIWKTAFDFSCPYVLYNVIEENTLLIRSYDKSKKCICLVSCT
jgi:hypothetical protein